MNDSSNSPWLKAKVIPSNPTLLITGEELIDLISLRTRFRTACRTIIQTVNAHPSAKRFAEEGLKLEYRESIIACSKDILVILDTSGCATHVEYVAKQTLRAVADRRR